MAVQHVAFIGVTTALTHRHNFDRLSEFDWPMNDLASNVSDILRWKKHPVFLTVLGALIHFEMHKILIYLPLPYQLSWWYVFHNCIILYHSWEGLWRWWLTYGEGRGHAGMRLGLYFLLYYTALSFLLPYCRAFAMRIHRTKLSFWELGSPQSAQWRRIVAKWIAEDRTRKQWPISWEV